MNPPDAQSLHLLGAQVAMMLLTGGLCVFLLNRQSRKDAAADSSDGFPKACDDVSVHDIEPPHSSHTTAQLKSAYVTLEKRLIACHHQGYHKRIVRSLLSGLPPQTATAQAVWFIHRGKCHCHTCRNIQEDHTL